MNWIVLLWTCEFLMSRQRQWENSTTWLIELSHYSYTTVKCQDLGKAYIIVWQWLKENLLTPQKERKEDQTQSLSKWKSTPVKGFLANMVRPASAVAPSQGPGHDQSSQPQFIWPKLPWSDQTSQPRKIPADNPFHARLKLKHSHSTRSSY